MAKNNYKPNISIHPGKTLAEILEFSKMSQAELSERTGLTKKTINEIVKGKNPITPDTAIKFASVFGTSIKFWNNLQRNYDEIESILKSQKNIENEIYFLNDFKCYEELVKLGFVDRVSVNNKKERVKNLMTFFGVSSLKLVSSIHNVAFRKNENSKISNSCIAAWLRCGEILAKKVKTKAFNRSKLIFSIGKIKKLMLNNSNNIEEKIIKICSLSGIAVVFLPSFKNTNVNGATFWLNKDKAVIQLSLTSNDKKNFWFNFFHELGHLVKHGKKEEFVEFGQNNFDNIKEKEADKFAEKCLLN